MFMHSPRKCWRHSCSCNWHNKSVLWACISCEATSTCVSVFHFRHHAPLTTTSHARTHTYAGRGGNCCEKGEMRHGHPCSRFFLFMFGGVCARLLMRWLQASGHSDRLLCTCAGSFLSTPSSSPHNQSSLIILQARRVVVSDCHNIDNSQT